MFRNGKIDCICIKQNELLIVIMTKKLTRSLTSGPSRARAKSSLCLFRIL